MSSVSACDRAEAVERGSGRGRVARKAGLPAAVAVGSVLLFFCYLRQSLTVAPTSDGAANALQAWDMLHGNLLLHGWALSDVSFYTTELPEYVLVESVRGLNIDVVNIAGALTYTTLVVVAALLAKGRAAGRAGLLRMAVAAGIMLSPQLGPGVNVLMLQPDHVGTTVPVLLAWLVVDRAGRRWWVPVAVGALLAWALVADPVVLYIGIVPLLAVASMRVYARTVRRRGRVMPVSFELALIAAALVAVAIGLEVPALVHSLGGYTVAAAPNVFGTTATMTSRLWLTIEGILLLFGANFLGSTLSFATGLVLLHLAGLGLAAWAFCRGVRGTEMPEARGVRGVVPPRASTEMPEARGVRGVVPLRASTADDIVVPLLVAGTAVIVAAYLFGAQAANIATTREIAAVLPFGAVLAGRLLGDRIVALRLVPVAAVVLLGYLISLAGNVATPAAQPPASKLTTWLAARGYRYGLANYWQANAVTLATGNRVRIRAVTTGPAHLLPYHWESKGSWYDPSLHAASFVVLLHVPPGNERYLPLSQVLTTFGRPARTYRVGRYSVLVWSYNLLTRL